MDLHLAIQLRAGQDSARKFFVFYHAKPTRPLNRLEPRQPGELG